VGISTVPMGKDVPYLLLEITNSAMGPAALPVFQIPRSKFLQGTSV
jgi:hypothetical protein